MNNSIKENLESLKAFKSNLTNENASILLTLIDQIKKDLPEKYRIKLSALKFYDYIHEAPSSNDLPF